jgi:hypothetical protein
MFGKPVRSQYPVPIELRLNTIAQLFHSLDPYPFRERDLDRDAEEFIVGWARELPHSDPLRIVIHLPQAEIRDENAQHVAAALRAFFAYRSEIVTHDLKELFSQGRISLVVGIVLLVVCISASHAVISLLGNNGAVRVISEGLVILGWVANWRPAEAFLYDWWPLARRRRLYRRLAEAEVELVAASHS